jgi:hypothetical protein
MASIKGAIFIKDGPTQTENNKIFGWSKSKITVLLCTEEKEIEIIPEFNHESKDVNIIFDAGEIEGYLSDPPLRAKPDSTVSCDGAGDNPLSFLLLNIDYIDLRCNFYAISLFKHDIYHWLRSDKYTPVRHVYYNDKSVLDDKNKPFFNIFNDDYLVDTSIKAFLKPEMLECPIFFSLDTYSSGFMQDVFITPLPPIENPPSHRQSSCAFDAINNQIVYYIKGGYTQTSYINADTKLLEWVDFEAKSKTDFINNHQIAFYYIDLGR